MLILTKVTADRTPLTEYVEGAIPIGVISITKLNKEVNNYLGLMILVNIRGKFAWSFPYEELFSELFVKIQDLPEIKLI